VLVVVPQTTDLEFRKLKYHLSSGLTSGFAASRLLRSAFFLLAMALYAPFDVWVHYYERKTTMKLAGCEASNGSMILLRAVIQADLAVDLACLTGSHFAQLLVEEHTFIRYGEENRVTECQVSH